MPSFEAVRDKEGYHAVDLHELTHWTRRQSRLGSSFDQKRALATTVTRGKNSWLELGSAFLRAGLRYHARRLVLAFITDTLSQKI
jgi:antirestriction protein ArdC